jgi:hypothetical protein
MSYISEKKLNEATLECYKRLYAASMPSADFNELVANATIGKDGRKNIPFMDYEILQEDMDKIIKDIMREYKIPKWYGFSVGIYLGCSPKTRHNEKEIND